MSWSVFEAGIVIIELALKLEHLFVGDEFDFVDFFYEVEDVHGADVVLAQLGYLAGDVDVVDGIVVFAAVFWERLLVDVLLGDEFVAQHSLYEWHRVSL